MAAFFLYSRNQLKPIKDELSQENLFVCRGRIIISVCIGPGEWRNFQYFQGRRKLLYNRKYKR